MGHLLNRLFSACGVLAPTRTGISGLGNHRSILLNYKDATLIRFQHRSKSGAAKLPNPTRPGRTRGYIYPPC